VRPSRPRRGGALNGPGAVGNVGADGAGHPTHEHTCQRPRAERRAGVSLAELAIPRADVGAIEKAVVTYGTDVTIGELIGAGVLSDALLVAGPSRHPSMPAPVSGALAPPESNGSTISRAARSTPR
jgi:hypothetical protein